MLDATELSACVKARQIGMSHTTGGVGVLWGAFHGELTTIISVGETESAEVLDKCKRHATLLQRFGSQLAKVARCSSTEIRFASGGRVLALPSTGGRGFTGNVFLDEYAYQQHAEKVWDAALAVTMHGGRARVASTPNGIGNRFHQLMTDPKSNRGWSLHSIPLKLAIAQGMPVSLDKCWQMALGDPRLFAQLFECSFLDGALQYIPTEQVSACSTDDLATWDGEYYAGLDVGLDNDLTALVVVRDTGDAAVVQAIETCKRTDSDALHALVDRAFATYRLRRLCIDATGIGAIPARDIQKRHGLMRVEPVTFTSQSKEDMATTLLSRFSSGTVRIPLTDAGLGAAGEPGCAEALRADICSIQRIVTSAGNVRYDAPRTAAGHADRAWALALALHAISTKPGAKHVITDGSYELG